MRFKNALFICAVLAVWTLSGCKKATDPFPQYDFSYSDTTETYNKIAFKSTAPAGSEMLWDFGDGSSSSEYNPTHIYKRSDSFTVTVNKDTYRIVRKRFFVHSSISRFLKGAKYLP